ncbi:uncharacterized protein LOC121856199 [Homarus americanus]|uniref:uncharacterized protein LOC121856199 n=1 Tax=Homarus americanus TaxID=6706 RepID=UPI001C46A498|nr:uncharacterized protein LOC121856199 [Homarus americanus]
MFTCSLIHFVHDELEIVDDPWQVFAWVAVFVLPLNAAINPLLYTVSTAPFLSKARERALNVRSSFRWSMSRRATNSSTGTVGDDRTTILVKPLDTLIRTPILMSRDLQHCHTMPSTQNALHLVASHANHLSLSRAHHPWRSQSFHGTAANVVTKRQSNEEWVAPQGEIIPLCELTNHTQPPLSRQHSRKKYTKHHHHQLYD